MPLPANGTNGASAIVDANGVPLSVGQTVKITAVITAINPWGKHYGEIMVTPVNRGNNPGTSAVPQYNAGLGGNIQGGVFVPNMQPKPFSIAPSIVILGS